jgi:hypothetical protein
MWKAGVACAVIPLLATSCGRSQGVLVADIGMTMEEVRQKSTFKFEGWRKMDDGSLFHAGDAVFDFDLRGIRFPHSRFYWISTPKNDPHIHEMTIGVSPRKMHLREVNQFERDVQQRLSEAGWIPGHYVADTERTIQLWGGFRTAGDGKYWLQGGTLVLFETNRMDDRTVGELEGEYIFNIYLRRKEAYPDLVFEKSAWRPTRLP